LKEKKVTYREVDKKNERYEENLEENNTMWNENMEKEKGNR
jgi:hypothetical protein